MATVGARRLLESTERLAELLAIESIALAQAVDLLGGPSDGFAASTVALHAEARALSPFLDEDRPLRRDILAVAHASRASMGT